MPTYYVAVSLAVRKIVTTTSQIIPLFITNV